jgi:hypothetical protein
MSGDEYALIEFRLGDFCERQQCNHREIAVRRDGRWLGRDSGLSVADDQITGKTPLYLVSLDAAIEAAAEQDCDDWENCRIRDVHREWARKALTAAVMGGAQ